MLADLAALGYDAQWLCLRAAAVVERHKKDWEEHRARFGEVPPDFEDGKLAKITAEMLRIRHDGERRAWGLDEPAAKPDIIVSWEP